MTPSASANGNLAWTYVPTSGLVNSFRYGLYTDRQADSFDQAELGGGLNYLEDNVNYPGNRFGSNTYLTPTLFAMDYGGNTTGVKNWATALRTQSIHLRS
jgi:hypothetical protein